MTGNFCRSIAAVVLAGFTALAPIAPVYGQNQGGQNQGQSPNAATTVAIGPDFTKPKRSYWNFLLPYTPIQLAEPQYTNGARIQQMIQDGKLPLSLQEAVELALQNNPDIAVQRYYSWIAETDILRTKGGGAQRGVNIVSTPVAFADVPTLSYDPQLTVTGNIDSRKFPANNPLTSGVGTSTAVAQSLATHTENVNFLYSQAFHTGTSVGLSFLNTRSTTTSSSVFFNPLLQSTGTLSVNQPLLNGFGLLTNERYIRVAVITKRVVDYAFQQSLITDLTAVENDYWELVFARGNVLVQQQAVDEAQQLYNDNQRQVEVGTLAPLEVVRAEAQLATAQQGLITAQTTQLQQQIILMSVISKDPNAQELRGVEIIPTDTTQTPPPLEEMPLAEAVNEATQNRPDVLQSKTNLQADDINVKAMRNGLLPTLNLSAYATYVGLSGNNKITTTAPGSGVAIDAAGNLPLTVFNQSNGGAATTLILPNTVTTTTGINPGGLGADLGSFFAGKYPEFEAQLSLTLPIRNRVAQADSTRAILAERQDQARYQQTVNAATVDVQNAQILLRQDRAVVLSAQKSRELQEATLDSDQKKLQLGASTIFIVVTDQQNLALAASAEVRAKVNLEEARVNFERALGRTLVAKRITIADGKTGVPQRDTLIPGTTAKGEIIGLKEALAALPNTPR